MATYNFGENILRYVQNQDELNLRQKQMDTEQARWNAQTAFQERQAKLSEKTLKIIIPLYLLYPKM